MKKYLHKTLLGAAVGFAAFAAVGAQAAELEMQWADAKEFRDIRAVNGSQQRFETRVMDELEAHFSARAAQHLPVGYTLKVHVSDLDLAGWVDYFYSPYNQEVRVVRDIDFPRLTFSYELLDAEGQLLAGGDEDIADMNFRLHVVDHARQRDFLFYEKRLIDKWFRDNFASMERLDRS